MPNLINGESMPFSGVSPDSLKSPRAMRPRMPWSLFVAVRKSLTAKRVGVFREAVVKPSADGRWVSDGRRRLNARAEFVASCS